MLARNCFSVHGGKGPFADRMFQVSCSVGVDEELIDEFCEIITDYRDEFASPQPTTPLVATDNQAAAIGIDQRTSKASVLGLVERGSRHRRRS